MLRHLILAISFFVLTNSVSSQCLSGNYTVAGSSPDYATFGDAVNDMVANGICGPVTFDIRSGSYYQQIVIPSITGSSAVNTITVQSEAAHRDSVILRYAGTSTLNFAIHLDGTDFIHFKNVTIRNSSTSYATVLRCTNNTLSNTFTNVHFDGLSGSGVNFYLVNFASGCNLSDNTFTDCYFNEGSILLAGASTIVSNNVTISGCEFWKGTSSALNFSKVSNLSISDNYFHNTTGTGTGIYVSQGSGWIEISYNLMTINSGSAANITGAFPSGIDSINFTNNYINVQTSSSTPAIDLEQVDDGLVAFNTIRSGVATVFNNCGQTAIYNNIFRGSSGSIELENCALCTVDYNCLYGAMVHESTSYPTLPAFQVASASNLNSIYHDPLMLGYPQIYSCLDIETNNAGLNISFPLDDIENQPRSSTPDMGADEYTPLGFEAKLLSINSSGFNTCAGWYPFSATIVNLGSETIDSVKFYLEVNGVPVAGPTWYGSVLSGDTVTTGFIDSIWIDPQTSHDIELGIHKLNDETDVITSNNFKSLNNINGAISGTFTVGGLFADFSNLTTAVNCINSFGQCGNVTFLLRDAVYSGSYYHLDDFYQSSPTDSVFIIGENQDYENVVLDYSGAASTFQVNDVDNVTLRYLTVRNTHYTGKTLIIHESDNCVVTDCFFEKDTPPNISGPNLNTICTGHATCWINLSTNVTLSDCIILNGTAGIAITGGSNNHITNNTIKYFSISGVNSNLADSVFIESNYIQSEQPAAFQNLSGLRFDASTDFTVGENEINIKNGEGLILINCSATDTNLFLNNAITNTTGNSVLLNGASDVSFRFNSFHNYPDEISLSNHLFSSTSASDVNFTNNIFSNSTTGKIFTTTPVGVTFDYNNYWYSGTSFSNSFANLSAWQVSGNDINSNNIIPGFVADTNLRIVINGPLGGSGLHLPAITWDLENFSRSNPPDPGAFNFGADTCDIELVAMLEPVGCDTSVMAKLHFINNGPDTLHAMTIFFSADSVMNSFVWNGLLAPGENLYHQFPLAAEFDSIVVLEAWSQMINGNNDPITLNDSISVSVLIGGMKGTFTVGGLNPDFQTLVAAVDTLRQRGMCGDVTFNLRNGLYVGDVDIENIPGLGGTNELLFQSEALQPDSCYISGEIVISGSSNITFQHLSIDLSSYQYIYLVGTVSNIAVQHCFLEDGNFGGLVSADGSAVSGIRFENNVLNNVKKAVDFDNFEPKSDILVRNNFFGVTSGMGIEFAIAVYSGSDVEISGNTIVNFDENGNEDFNYVTAIELRNCADSIRVVDNILPDNLLLVEYCNNTASNPLLVQNNMIGRVYIHSSDYVDLFHNTILYRFDDPDEGGLRISNGSDHIKFFNNIVFLQACEFAISYSSAATPDFQSDYNLFFSEPVAPYFFPTENLGILSTNLGGTGHSLADWQTLTGLDLHSQWGNPGFITYENPHLNPDNLSPFFSSLVMSGVPTDIDGDARNLSTPSYGADEYFNFSNNAQLVSFEVPVQCGDQKDLYVKLANCGTSVLTSAVIQWQTNGVAQTPMNWSGTLAPADTQLVFLGTSVLGGSNIATVTAWSELPNGSTDPFTQFDTISLTIYQPYSGTYTVGGVAPHFDDLQTAIDSLELYGICDSVMLDIRPGLYTETIVINKIGGTSDSAWVIIQSESLDSSTVLYKEDGYVFTLVSTDHIMVRQLSIENTGGGYTGCLRIVNHSSNISVLNNYLLNKSISAHMAIEVGAMTSDPFLTSYYRANSNLIIRANKITTETSGIYISGVSDETTGLEKTKSVLIANNFLDNPPPYVATPFYSELIVISNVLDLTIEHNHIELLTSEIDGIRIILCDSAVISNNTLFIERSAYCLYVSSSDHLIVRNNEISVDYSDLPGAGGPGGGIAIQTQNCLDMLVLNNSVRIDSMMPAGQAFHAFKSSGQVLNNQFIHEAINYVYSVADDSGLVFDYNNYFTDGTSIANYDGTLYNLSGLQSLLAFDQHSIIGDPQFQDDTTLLSLNGIGTDVGLITPYVTDDILYQPRLFGNDAGAYELDDFSNNAALVNLVAQPEQCGDSLSLFVNIENVGLDVLTDIELIVSATGLSNFSVSWTGSLLFGQSETNYFVAKIPVLSLPCTYSIEAINPNGLPDQNIFNNTAGPFDYSPTVYAINEQLCYGDSILIAGVYQTIAGTYGDTLVSIDGCDSILSITLTISNLITHTVNQQICQGDSILIAGIYQSTTGTYPDTLISVSGCDSILYTSLNIFTINANVILTDHVFYASPASINMQWLDCSNGYNTIFGQTSTSYTPTQNGSYAVEITDNGCVDTSACVDILDLNLNENTPASLITIYPNPNNGNFQIDFPQVLDYAEITIRDNSQRIIFTSTYFDVQHVPLKIDAAGGIYFISIEDNDGALAVFRVVKQ